jgi:adenylate kinase
MPGRATPNILITGTPGSGKTSLASSLCERSGLTHINVSEYIKEKGYHAGRDEAFDTLIIDEESEDKLLDDLEVRLENGGIVVDFHSSELFPERWFDLVLVLRVDNTVLYDRLLKRGYNTKKITENIECEIMNVVAEEAKGSYSAEIVHERTSNTIDDMENTLDAFVSWIGAFKSGH